ncbi:MAG: RluA family pseudouridine synthase [Dissulfurispiraceae bacterium]|jgi:23S rRNA pseudouridine1911/1915/1917 synthase|nr:RluA family pseudouridine synthase [Dissulfurispiraceae bacterium]
MTKIMVDENCNITDLLLAKGYKKSSIRNLLKHSAILLDGKFISRFDHPLAKGQTILIESRPITDIKHAIAPPFEILFEDEHIIAINKPAGLLTIATESEKTNTAYYLLNAYLKERDPENPERIFIVHRLDRDTSGIVLFAKNETAKRTLQDNWTEVDKKYLVIAEGIPKVKEGTLRSYLRETKTFKVYSTDKPIDAKLAVTNYEVLKAGSGCSLLEIDLETGRKNQIRVQLADIGHPVVGDKKYGAAANPFKRLALHAHSLTFNHPDTHKRMQLKSRMPGELKKFANTMKAV